MLIDIFLCIFIMRKYIFDFALPVHLISMVFVNFEENLFFKYDPCA